MAQDNGEFARKISEMRTLHQLVELLGDRGRPCAPVQPAMLAIEDAPFASFGDQAWLLDPGSGAHLWVLERAGDTAGLERTLDRELRRAARKAPTGCAALVLLSERSNRLSVAMADLDAVQSCRAASRDFDERAEDAWSALCSALPLPVACLRAYRLLEKRAVGRAFFTDVRAVVDELVGAWEHGPPEHTERHALAIGLLCRLMFLYFVQQRGWLDQDGGFIAAMVLDPDADQLYRDRLLPLFFDVLNTPVDARSGRWALRRIPYLNGGLFEPSASERSWPDLTLPDPVVRAVVEVLERYRFVGSERDRTSVAVDPAMLGTVFESLMNPRSRERSGTFYTPPGLVDAVVSDAIDALLAERGGLAWLRALDADSARRVLGAWKVLDPAMGSGAFLLGALHRLSELRREVLSEPPSQALRSVVEHNLYGVDRSPVAVTIAGLRLWLALACAPSDEPGPVDPRAVAPLPNLSHRLRCGDSLFGIDLVRHLDRVRGDDDAIEQLRVVSEGFGDMHGRDKARAAARMRELERRVATSLLEDRARAIDARRRELQAAREPDLFGHRREWSVAQRREARELGEAASQVERELASSRAGVSSPPFDLRAHFAPVLRDGGFDLVVGNPPWVRASKLDRDLRTRLRGAYRWVAEAGRGRAFGAQPDLSVAFVERSVDLLRPGGVLGFVVPSKLFTAGYADGMRAGLCREAPPVLLRDLSESPVVRFAADVLPAVVVARKRSTDATSPAPRVRVVDGSGRSGVTSLNGLGVDERPGAEWVLLDERAVALLRRLGAEHRCVEDAFGVRMGIKTGANRCFVDVPLRSPLSRPLLRGGDVSPMRVAPGSTMLLAHDPGTGAALGAAELDSTTIRWFEEHTNLLMSRSDAQPADPPWRVFRIGAHSLGHRVVWRDIGERLDAAYVPPVVAGGPLALNTTYLVPVAGPAQGRRLAAWLCSTPARFVAAARAERALSGYRRFMAGNVGAVPVTRAVLDGGPVLDAAAAAVDDDPGDPMRWRRLDEVVARSLGLGDVELELLRGAGDRLSCQSRELRGVVLALRGPRG